MNYRMNVHSSVLAMVFSVGCATDATVPSVIETRLDDGIELTIAPAALGVTIINSKDDVVGIAPAIEGGFATIVAVDGDLQLASLELAIADIEVPAELTTLGTPMTFVDARITSRGASPMHTTWSEHGVRATLPHELVLDWSLQGARGPAPLASQIVRVELAIDLAIAADGPISAQLSADKQGLVWHFGELTLRDLAIDVTMRHE
jgi:hypothetical protein